MSMGPEAACGGFRINGDPERGLGLLELGGLAPTIVLGGASGRHAGDVVSACGADTAILKVPWRCRGEEPRFSADYLLPPSANASLVFRILRMKNLHSRPIERPLQRLGGQPVFMRGRR